jgi:hypothetical protein
MCTALAQPDPVCRVGVLLTCRLSGTRNNAEPDEAAQRSDVMERIKGPYESSGALTSGWWAGWRPIGLAALLSLPLFGVAFLAAGFGHGTLVPMCALFPLGPIVALAGGPLDTNDIAGVVAAVLQYPSYAFVIRGAVRRGWGRLGALAVVGFHVLAAALAVRQTY